jgi:hypothetical protein
LVRRASGAALTGRGEDGGGSDNPGGGGGAPVGQGGQEVEGVRWGAVRVLAKEEVTRGEKGRWLVADAFVVARRSGGRVVGGATRR